MQVPVRECTFGHVKCLVLDETRMSRDAFRRISNQLYLPEMQIPRPIQEALEAGDIQQYKAFLSQVACTSPEATIATTALTIYGRHHAKELLAYMKTVIDVINPEATPTASQAPKAPKAPCPWCIFGCSCNEFDLSMMPLCDMLPLNPLHAQ